MSNVDWSASPAVLPSSIVDQAYTGAARGLDLGQKLAQVHALQGVDLNNPASLDNAITGLIHSNSFDQANALMGLNATRTIYSNILPMVAAKLQGNNASSQAPPDQGSQFDAAHAQVMGDAQQAVTTLQNTPIDQRPQVAAQIKAQFQAQHPNIPEGAIDAQLNDLSDAGLASTAAHFQDHGAWMQAGGPASGQPAPPHPTGYDWARNALSDTTLNDPFVQAALKKVGFDIEPYFQRALTAEAPEIQAANDIQKALPIASATQAAETAGTAARVPLKIAEASGTAEAQQSAQAEHDLVTVHYTPPGGGPTQDIQMRRSDALALQHQIPGLGVSNPEVTTAFQKQDADNLAKTTDTAADPNRIQQHQQSDINGRQIIGLASEIGTGKYTPYLQNIAQGLAPMLGQDANSFVTRYANNAQLLAQDLSQAMRQSFSGTALPRIQTEYKMLASAVPTNASPADTIKLTGAGLVSKANYEANYDRFMTDWASNPQNPKSLTAANEAWLKGPGATSPLADPVWRGLTIEGKPAVQIAPKPINGHIYGVFMPGTKQAQTFIVQ